MKEECMKHLEYTENLFTNLLKVYPSGLQNIGKYLGFDPCSGNPTFYETLLNHMEPIVYFIINLL